jgi:arabinogalactan oligomer / maltooligosaccharide transport system permease protein
MIRTRSAYFYIAPALIVMAALVFYPLINGIYLSFTDASQYNAARRIGDTFTPSSYQFIGLQNYISVFTTPTYYFWSVFGQTIVWTIANIIPHILIGLGLGLLLNRKMRGRGIYRMLLIIPWAVPAYISGFVWRFIFNGEYGFLNSFLGELGLGSIPWLADPAWAMVAVVIANTWLAIPFNMVSVLGGLQSIPADLYEAAEVDGASSWQRFLHITMPMLRPVLMTITLLGVIWTFNAFNVIFLVTEGGPFRSTEILATWAWRLGFQQLQYGIAAAYSVIILLILLFFSVVYVRIMSGSRKESVL